MAKRGGYNFDLESKGVLPRGLLGCDYYGGTDVEEFNKLRNEKKIKLKEFTEASPENKKMALICALLHASYDDYEFIMNAGSKLNFKEGDINSAILIGISRGPGVQHAEWFEKCIDLSLQNGVDINSTVEGKSFISIITENNLIHQIVTLLEHNVSIDKETYSKNTQLFSEALKEITGKNAVKRLQNANNGFNSYIKLLEKGKSFDIELS